MSVMYESGHDAITFHLLEMSSMTDTTTDQKQFRIFAQGTFFKRVLGDFTELHNEKKSIWKLCVKGIVSVTGICVNVNQIS